MTTPNLEEHEAELVEFWDILIRINHTLNMSCSHHQRGEHGLEVLRFIRKAKTMLHAFNKFSDEEIMELIKQARSK